MLKRTLTGAFIVAVSVGFFALRLIDYRLFDILLFALSVLGTMEMITAFKDKTSVASKIITLLFSAAVVPLTCFFGLTGLIILSGAFLVVALLLLVFDYKNLDLNGFGFTLMSYLYPNVLIAVMVLMNALDGYGFIAMLLAFVIGPFADTSAYLVGSLIKGKKLCPTISPHKTISGAIGGVLGGIIGSVILYYIAQACGILPEITFMSGILLFILIGLVASVFTELGDLVESAIKRKAEIKDFGKVLPGHGGILDRIDGLMLASVILFAVFKLIIVFAV